MIFLVCYNILVYTNNNHYNLLYPKRENQKLKKIYDNFNDIKMNKVNMLKNTNISFIKKPQKYALVKYKKSSNIYNEIYEFLLSVKKK